MCVTGVVVCLQTGNNVVAMNQKRTFKWFIACINVSKVKQWLVFVRSVSQWLSLDHELVYCKSKAAWLI